MPFLPDRSPPPRGTAVERLRPHTLSPCFPFRSAGARLAHRQSRYDRADYSG
jgi:hypothetical protein